MVIQYYNVTQLKKHCSVKVIVDEIVKVILYKNSTQHKWS